jgi:hypothetical protein
MWFIGIKNTFPTMKELGAFCFLNSSSKINLKRGNMKKIARLRPAAIGI